MARDLNGKSVVKPVLSRVAAVLRRDTPERELDPLDLSLRLVVESFDDAAAASAVLASSPWRAAEQAVVRHVIAVPAQQSSSAIAMVADDAYIPVEASVSIEPTTFARIYDDLTIAERDLEVLVLGRAQLVDALHISQERSRMAGLAARHGGTVLGWQVWQA